MPNVIWSVGDWRVGPSRQFTSIGNRSLKLSLLEPSEATATLTGQASSAFDPGLGTKDVWIRRDGEFLYRGRIYRGDLDLDQNKFSLPITATDYRGVLDHRIVHGNITFTTGSPTLAYIAWTLITHTQSRYGGNLGLTQAADWPAGGSVNNQFVANDGDTIWKSIQNISKTDPQALIDPSLVQPAELFINPDMTVSFYNAGKGTDKGVILDYGGAVKKVSRTTDLSTYANSIRQSGAATNAAGAALIPQEVSIVPEASPEGLWEQAVSNPDLATQQMIYAAAQISLIRLHDVWPAYSVELKPGFWRGTSHIGLGDTVTLIVKAGDYDIQRSVRVHEIAISWDSSNNESVTLNLSQNSLKGAAKLRQHLKTLALLAKR